MEKCKRNLLFLAVILAGGVIAVYGENRYITRVRANSFRFLDSRNKNIDIATVQEPEARYHDSKSLFDQVNEERELSIEKLPF